MIPGETGRGGDERVGSAVWRAGGCAIAVGDAARRVVAGDSVRWGLMARGGDTACRGDVRVWRYLRVSENLRNVMLAQGAGYATLVKTDQLIKQ